VRPDKKYAGIHNDSFGGMTPTGAIVKDAWVFGLLPETEQCEGWSVDEIQKLYDRVQAAWDRHGQLPSRLPPELRERHSRIHGAAIARARTMGWDPELSEDE
jgi:hypothetical protein